MRDWDWGCGSGIGILGLGFGIGDWDWVFGFGIGNYFTAFIMLIWMLCGCWINEKLAPTQSDIILGLL